MWVLEESSNRGAASNAVVARPEIAEALVWVSVWVCGFIAVILGIYAWVTGSVEMLRPTLITAAIAVVGSVQRMRHSPRPLLILTVASTGLALMVPIVDIAGHVVILPTLIVLGSIGALALPRRVSAGFATWCAALSAASLHWILPGHNAIETILMAVVLVGVHVASWRFVSIAGELLVAEERRTSVALADNRRLLEFEQALALCSRALLMESGEVALEAALGGLRTVIDADKAYLAINTDDPELGPCFQVVKSALAPGVEEEEGVKELRAWSRYSGAAETLGKGTPFQFSLTGDPGEWDTLILSVPVFVEGKWIATLGFIGVDGRTMSDEEAIRMLEVAAPMLGTFWEREVTRRRLEELVESKDRFVASVSHELRTPLAAVLGFAEELKANASSFHPEELADMLKLIADQSQEMAHMVEDLLVSARVDIGKVSIHTQDVYLRSQAEAVLAGLTSVDGKEIEVVGGRGKVWADPSRTRQIIRNLVTNAIRYGGHRIRIEAIEAGAHTALTVRDDGQGLDPTVWERIFEPYQRAHDVPTQPSSIGLGLSVARQLARLMGGDLVYHSSNGGSVFALTLPAEPDGLSKLQEQMAIPARA